VSKQTKPQGEVMTKAEDLQAKIDATRIQIQRAIVAGDNTVKLRQFAAELEEEQRKMNAATARENEAQAAAASRAQDELDAASHVLAESRLARLNLLSDKYRAPQRPAMSHA
jgi:hypothetical protein